MQTVTRYDRRLTAWRPPPLRATAKLTKEAEPAGASRWPIVAPPRPAPAPCDLWPICHPNSKEGPHMSTKSALRADLDAEDRKTLAEDRKRMVCGTRTVP